LEIQQEENTRKRSMKNKRFLPMPFLVLILAGVVSLSSSFLGRDSRAGTVRADSLQVQTVQQEHLAAVYFRILSWLSEITPQSTQRVKANHRPAPTHKDLRTPRRSGRPDRMEFCAFDYTQNPATINSRASSFN
jgi:hypothetical protein